MSEDKDKIQNLNQIVAHAAGRLDVLHKILNGVDDETSDITARQTLFEAKRFINKGKDNLDKMLERHSKGERCVE